MRIQEQLSCLTLVVTALVVGCGKSDPGGAAVGVGGSAVGAGAGSTASGNSGGTAVGAGGSSSTGGTTAGVGVGGTATSTGGTTVGVGGNNSTGGAAVGVGGASNAQTMSFFVTSDKSTTGNLGGLVGADARCQGLATMVGLGAGVWHAYLSAEPDPANNNLATNARDRIGKGPWYNKNGLLLANNLDALHALTGNPDVFVDENGLRINGQWVGSPTPNEHDVLTGSTATGTLMTGFTCQSWTSNSSSIKSQVGHTDGLGPGASATGYYTSWNSSHANGSCADTAPMGGAGRLYCFLVN